jgi:hypothetical protein
MFMNNNYMINKYILNDCVYVGRIVYLKNNY